MAKRSRSKKAPVWLADRGAKPGKPQAKSEQTGTAAEKKLTDVKGAIHGNDAPPVKVDEYSEAELATMLERIELIGHPYGLRIAGRRLLRVVADLPSVKHLRRGQIDHLRARLVMEIRTFEKLCHRASFDRNHIVGASYCLCAALDEAAHHTPWGGGGKDGIGAWSQHSLTAQFHGDRDGGTKVYQLLARLVEDSDANLVLIYLIYIITSLGFMGQYRVKANGDREHQLLRQKLYTIIKARVPPVPRELSPSLHVATERNLRPIGGIPVWVTAVVCMVVLAGTYAYFQFKLHKAQEETLQAIDAINKMVAAPPPLPALDAPKSRANITPGRQQSESR
ncbi:type IVB secretion system protein IcmH/DotU [Ralstonia sp. UBA689]|uniref:type IVB secretion system protein IcmH/DotU n=1 Tax=Ralstonia sp. UBA689 TaxID=1947373 RepID=UPI0026002DA7|nr:type IVB secretion system protein IcmH/DotU [Ralstonia sp. UBA689]